MQTISIIALVVSCLALPFTMWAARAAARQADAARMQARAAEAQTAIQKEQVDAARAQTDLQRELALQAAQPYVWADIQPDMQQGTMLQVVVGNRGPTLARDVRVMFEPPLPAGSQQSDNIATVQRVLAEGLLSLAPDRVIRWSLGAGSDLLSEETPQRRTVRVEAEGPNGPIPALEFDVDISQWRSARDAPDGSLHHLRGELKELTKAVKLAAPRA